MLAASLSGCAFSPQQTRPTEAAYVTEVSAGLEEIYVTRTTRTQYMSGATPACAAAPFSSASEPHYDTWSVSLRPLPGEKEVRISLWQQGGSGAAALAHHGAQLVLRNLDCCAAVLELRSVVCG